MKGLNERVEELRIVDSATPGLFREYLLSHEGLCKIPERAGESDEEVRRCFEEDLKEGRLRGYEGTFVAYQKTVFCGQSKSRNKIVRGAKGYYGSSSLRVFEVPEDIV